MCPDLSNTHTQTDKQHKKESYTSLFNRANSQFRYILQLEPHPSMHFPTTTTRIVSLLLLMLLISHTTEGGVTLYGVCQTGCAAVVVACYGAAGATFGTITAGVGTPAAILACNAAFGLCSAKCAATLLLPTPWCFFLLECIQQPRENERAIMARTASTRLLFFCPFFFFIDWTMTTRTTSWHQSNWGHCTCTTTCFTFMVISRIIFFSLIFFCYM